MITAYDSAQEMYNLVGDDALWGKLNQIAKFRG
jgi:hypothetical protein